MEISSIFLLAFLTLIFNAVLFYVTMKYIEKRAILIAAEIISVEKAGIQEDLRKYVNTEDFQKALYQFGVLAGNGLIQGAGIQKGTGKMSIKNLITQGIVGFIQQKAGGLIPGLQNQAQTNLKLPNKPNIIPEAK